MDKLSKQAENHLLNCVSDAIQLVNNGSDPTDAIVKVARANDLNQPMTQRVLEAYNQSKTLHELSEKKGSSRLSEFSIAKSAAVMDALFPKNPKTPLQKQASSIAISSITSRIPNYIEKVAKHNAERESQDFVKQASATPTIPSYLLDKPEPNYKQLDRDINQANKLYKEAEDLYVDEKENFLKLATDLSDQLRSMFFSCPFHKFEAAFNREFNSPELVKLAYNISNAGNLGQHRLSSMDQVGTDFTLTDLLGPAMYGSVESLVKSATNLHKQAQALLLKKKLLSEKQALFEATNEALGFAGRKLHEAGEPDTSLYNKELGNAVIGLTDPKFRDRLEQIRIQSMLHDFTTNDEVISKYPIDQVAELFNQLQDVAPRAASKPAVMKDMLRRALVNGGSEALEIGQLASLNKNLDNTNSMTDMTNDLMTSPHDITRKMDAEQAAAKAKQSPAAKQTMTSDTGIMGSLKNITSPLSGMKTEFKFNSGGGDNK